MRSAVESLGAATREGSCQQPRNQTRGAIRTRRNFPKFVKFLGSMKNAMKKRSCLFDKIRIEGSKMFCWLLYQI